VIFLTEIAPSNLYVSQLIIFLMNSIFESWELSNFFQIIFNLSLIFIGIVIAIYLLKLVIVSIRLFQGFWASLEDED
jgi:hypothetical protein